MFQAESSKSNWWDTFVTDGIDFTHSTRNPNVFTGSVVDIMLMNWFRRRKGNKDISNGFIANHNCYQSSAMG